MKNRNHLLLDNPILSSFLMPVLFMVMLNLMSTFTALLFENTFGKTSLLYMINDDIACFCVSVLFIIFMNQFFKKNYHFGITSGNFKKGMLLSLPGLIIVFWNLLQIIVNHLPLVSGTNAIIAAIIAGIGPGVAEEIIREFRKIPSFNYGNIRDFFECSEIDCIRYISMV